MNKLILDKGKAMACLILMCLFLAQSCRKDNLMPNSNDLRNGLSIAEAKSYFEANVKQMVRPKKVMSIGGVGSDAQDHSFETVLNGKRALWDRAYETLISTGAAVKIPLDFGQAYAIVSPEKKAVVPFGSLNYLMMYKDSGQTIHAEWVLLLPDSAWLYGNRDKYTGNIFVKNWEGRTIKQFSYSKMPQTNIVSTISVKKLSALTAPSKLMTGGNGGPVVPFCVSVSDTVVVAGKCKCVDEWLALYGCDRCPDCVDISIKKYCTWPFPDEEPSEGGNDNNNPGGTTPGSGGGNIPGGSPGPGDYTPPPCVPDPNYVPIVNPDGSMSPAPCIPIPHDPPPPQPPVLSQVQFLANILLLSDSEKAFLTANSSVTEAFVNYLAVNASSPQNINFLNSLLSKVAPLSTEGKLKIADPLQADLLTLNSPQEKEQYILALEAFKQVDLWKTEMESPGYNVADDDWIDRLDKIKEILLNPTTQSKLIIYTLKLYAEARAATALLKTSLFLLPTVGSLTEQDKEYEFNTNAKHTVAILLWEFGKGLGKTDRDFVATQPITQNYVQGGNGQRLKNLFNNVLQKNNLLYSDFKLAGQSLGDKMSYSPGQANFFQAIELHLKSDLSRFFIAGADAIFKPTNQDGWVEVEILNEVNAESLMLHLWNNYPRNQGETQHRILSTINQHYRFLLNIYQ